MHCEHEHDDGAYVLGALSPAERAAYERHLATCSFCREAVADISTLPDLLSRLDAKEFAKLLDPSLTGDHPGASLRDMAAPAAARGKRRKNLGVRVLSTVGAAVLVVLVGVGLLAWTRDPVPPGPTISMTTVEAGSPIHATVRLTGGNGGTRIDLVCSYSAQAAKTTTFRLIAYSKDDEQEQVGSWSATPGADFTMPAFTHFARTSLAHLALVRADGRVMLAYDVP